MNRIAGASVWEQEVFEHLDEHREAEASIIDDYRQLADQSSSDAFRYLVNLILEDEARHHRVLGELADAVRSCAELTTDGSPVPFLDLRRTDNQRVLAATERFLDVEKNDLHELEELAKRLRPVRDTTLWYLLVKLMEQDTNKHILTLKFIRDRIRQAGGT